MYFNFQTIALSGVLLFLVFLAVHSSHNAYAQVDNTPPSLTIDTTSGPDRVSGAQDDISGVQFVSVFYIAPDDDSTETHERAATHGASEEPNKILSLDVPMQDFMIVPGDMVSFVVDIENTASANNTRALTRQTAAGVVFKVNPPEGFDIQELITTKGTCSINTLECTIGDIESGETVSVAIEAVIPENDGVYTVSFQATTSSGEEFGGSAIITVESAEDEVEVDSGGTNGNGGCALVSSYSAKAGVFNDMTALILLPFILVMLRRLRKRTQQGKA